MVVKKGLWLAIALMLTINTAGMDFEWQLTQTLSGEINSFCPNERLLLELPEEFRYEIEARAGNAHAGKNIFYVGAKISMYDGDKLNFTNVVSGESKEENWYWTSLQNGTGTKVTGCHISYKPKKGNWYDVPVRVLADIFSAAELWYYGFDFSAPDGYKCCGPDLGVYEIFLHSSEYKANVMRIDEKKLIGTVQDLAKPKYFEKAVKTATTKTETIILSIDGDSVYACVDVDRNKQCDYEQAKECDAAEGDWNALWAVNGQIKTNPVCCGITAGYDKEPCAYYPELDAVCGKDENGKWKWAASALTGETRKLKCPEPVSFLSDGEKLTRCGAQFANIAGFTRTSIKEHEFFCSETADIHECAGESMPLGENKYNKSGEWIESPKETINFCSTKGKWVTDINNKEDCEAARENWKGVQWTGSKCCGDPADNNTPEATYEETTAEAKGACYENTFVQAGDVLDNERTILNYKGRFYGCNQTTANKYFSSTGIMPAIKEACGTPLFEAVQTGTKKHALCTPAEKWMFTNSNLRHWIKSTAWEPEQENQNKQGCCPEDYCWDGNECSESGVTKLIAEKGFVCQ